MDPDGCATDWKATKPQVSHRWHLVALACAWTFASAGSLAWSLVQIHNQIRLVSSQTARALLEKDLLYREWSILHGGVYVPRSNSSQSSASAILETNEEREIRTPSGRVLTLLNPALVSRQIFQLQDETMRIRGHITSLNPLRVANLPDPWERQALERLARRGEADSIDEISSTETRQGERYFRMMRPLITNRSCLQCHEEKGRKEGTLRGGISVLVPMSPFAIPGQSRNVALAHVGLWLIGLTGLHLGARDLQRQVTARQCAEAERERVIGDLQRALAEVKTLSGLIPICASCKKIRDDQGYWTQIETFVQEHSNATFSHSLCLECLHKLYPEVAGTVERQLTMNAPAGPGAGKASG